MNVKQLRILNVLHRVENPSLHGLSVMTGIPMSTLVYHLSQLVKNGYVRREFKRARTIRSTPKTALIKFNGRYSELVEVVYSDPEQCGGRDE